MASDDDIRIRPGRIRQTKPGKGKSFVSRVLAATQKAGGLYRSSSRGTGRRAFGRGRAASFSALHGLTSRSRIVVVKARVVRHHGKATPLAAHLSYLRRDGVTRDGAPGKMFDEREDGVDANAFAERCQGDRHHFRFIVAPDDAMELTDLCAFTRDLMGDVTRDLGTKLDWVGVDHWNTEHPHVHVLVRGRADDGADLVISRDYISRGLRARAERLATLELGLRSEKAIRQSLERQVDADRWTPLDQALTRDAAKKDGLIDLRPNVDQANDVEQSLLLGRARKLEKLGLTTPVGVGKWVMADEAESVLRKLGERGDIIKRIHRGLAAQGVDRATGDFSWDSETHGDSIIGRLISRGLDDELRGSAFAIIDGIDGRTHHVRFNDIDATGDAAPGAIVEVRLLASGDHRAPRLVLAVRSDLSIEDQIHANGATWLDRRLVAKAPTPITELGFGQDVRDAMEARTDHLVAEGLAKRQGQRLVFVSNLLETLRARELNDTSARLTSETSLPRHSIAEGDSISGVYRKHVTLASGRYAMIDDGFGFSLVPWTPSLGKELGRQVSGVMNPGGGVDWTFGRKRAMDL